MNNSEQNDLITLPNLQQLGKMLFWFLLVMVLSHFFLLLLESKVGLLSYYYPEQLSQFPLLSKLLG
ncbi:hypothetical protein [Rheinheimera sp.]|uniref:hypothetical protein n=1 Tax=Rheinheimera sp. TaxID=1869214 RepID=UPI0027B903AB|nr:hypothetical protein [Rheinheimera sp.]